MVGRHSTPSSITPSASFAEPGPGRSRWSQYLSDHGKFGLKQQASSIGRRSTGRIYRNIEELRNAVRGFVEQYNAQWLVEKNDYLSPAQARQAWDPAMSLRPAA